MISEGATRTIRRYGVEVSTICLVAFIVVTAIMLDIAIHRLLNEPMGESFILLDTIIASVIATPISLILLRMIEKLDAQREKLKSASAEIRELKGLIPICSSCKKIRDDEGFWHQVDVYIRQHTSAEFTHSLCSDCAAEIRKDFS